MGSVASPVCLRMPPMNGEAGDTKPAAIQEQDGKSLGVVPTNGGSFIGTVSLCKVRRRIFNGNSVEAQKTAQLKNGALDTAETHSLPIESSLDSKISTVSFSSSEEEAESKKRIEVPHPDVSNISLKSPLDLGSSSPKTKSVSRDRDALACSGRSDKMPECPLLVDCADQLEKLRHIRKRHELLYQKMYRIQTKSGVEVAYSELKQVVSKSQKIFKIPCLMNQNGLNATQSGPREKNIQHRKFVDGDSLRLKRGCGTYEALIANCEKLCDSSATESSSEEEELPEKMKIFNGRRHLTPFRYTANNDTPLSRHPTWRWSKQRAGIGAKWTWLQAQVSELEYRIRQQQELCRQLKLAKQPCIKSPKSWKKTEESLCARVIPINENFKKRRLVHARSFELRFSAPRQTDSACIVCDCGSLYPHMEHCLRCSQLYSQAERERLESRQSDGLSAVRQLSGLQGDSENETYLLSNSDSSYHYVLSGKEDISLNLHYEDLIRAGYSTIAKRNSIWENSESSYKKKKDIMQKYFSEDEDSRDNSSSIRRKKQKTHALQDTRTERKPIVLSKLSEVSRKRKMERRNTLPHSKRSFSVESQEQFEEDINSDTGEKIQAGRPRKTSHVSQQENSYDIDNIVIPYGMMSCTRLTERLKYKEILTPKWRVVNVATMAQDHKRFFVSGVSDTDLKRESAQQNPTEATNRRSIGLSKEKSTGNVENDTMDACNAGTNTLETEKLNEETFEVRHEKQELLERQRFSSYVKPKVTTLSTPPAEHADSSRNRESCLSTTSLAKDSRTLSGDLVMDNCDDDDTDVDSTQAKRERSSFPQDWSMFQSSVAPKPYPPRNFPLSNAEYVVMIAENPTNEQKVTEGTSGENDHQFDSQYVDDSTKEHTEMSFESHSYLKGKDEFEAGTIGVEIHEDSSSASATSSGAESVGHTEHRGQNGGETSANLRRWLVTTDPSTGTEFVTSCADSMCSDGISVDTELEN